MKTHLLVAGVALATFVAGAVAADPVTNLSDGLAALDRHDEEAAIRLLSDALSSGMLGAANRELALVKRAEAYLLAGRDADALHDANQAIALQPADVEAQRVRNYAAQIDLPPPHGPIFNNDRSLNAAVAARNIAVNAELSASQVAYQQRKAADAEDYAAKMAAYDASVRAQQQQAAAAQAAWQAAVAACKAGDHSKCAKP